MNVLICDPISAKGISYFRQQPRLNVTVLEKPPTEAELLSLVAEADAVVVRSETKIRRSIMEAAPKLKVVGRAGVGVDNIDTETATARGIVVMNTPAGNTISTAELTFSMLMSLARKIPQANASMKGGEWNRKSFSGIELYNKTLGILGMGRIGGEVAKRAVAFGMKVLAYDPYLTAARAAALRVELVEDLGQLYPQVDFLTVHIPMTEETKGMVNAEAFARMKRGVRVLNCARGGIVNEKDLLAALQSGQVAGAALDVYEIEPLPKDSPLRAHPNIIMTPHLGASTDEAQENVGIEVAEAITEYLLHGTVRNAVNLPNLDAKTYAQVLPYLLLGEKLGRLLAQLAPKQVDRLFITYGGKAQEIVTDPVTRSILRGFLEFSAGKDINHVNVRDAAAGRGLLVEEKKSDEPVTFNEWLHVAVYSQGEKKVSAGGTFFGSPNNPRIVRLFSMPVEIVPSGIVFLMNNKDRPGMVGHIGTLMGKHKINIASMSLSRDQAGGQALTVLNLDNPPPAAALDEIRQDPDISNVRVVKL
ncbi:MAG TPA: phosphoglycerate dehydrogenase [Verrucomicrobiae bacterium]|nr:phosphoglycerate dehydrogenase [Verrucomicrobiae bacterium]